MSKRKDESNSIKVACRFRPLNKKEIQMGSKVCIMLPEDSTDAINLNTLDGSKYNFTFDRVFGSEATQQQVYEYAAKPIVEDVLNGYNGCLLAYGQTGSGKTHTMTGPSIEDETHRGVIPRVVDHIFDFAMRADECMEFTVKVSFVEIYMERIRDLLDSTKTNLQVGEDPQTGVFIKEVTETYTGSPDEMYDIMQRGNENRSVAATGMNAGSSRSHSLFIITLTQKNNETGVSKIGRFYLVDLAGSETVNKTGVTGQQLEEAKKINQSLSALGNVIKALTGAKSRHVPYRDSKLTRVLQESLGGNSRTALIVNCSPSSYNEMETLSTLRFGKRAKTITNRAVVNKERSPAEMKRYITVLERRIELYEAKERDWVHAFKTGEVSESLRAILGISASDGPAKKLEDLSLGESDTESKEINELTDDGVDNAQKSRITELEQHVAMLSEVLQEASEELKSLRKQVNEKDSELQQTKARLHHTEAEISRLQKHGMANDEPAPRSDEESADATTSAEPQAENEVKAQSKDESSDQSSVPSSKMNLLQDNYRRAMEENESLREEIADMDAELTRLKKRLETGEADQDTLQQTADELAETHNDFKPISLLTPTTVTPSKSSLGIEQDVARRLPGLVRAHEELFEHQRLYPGRGWSSDLFESDPPTWSDKHMLETKTKESITLPSDSWYWLNDWSVDQHREADEHGWVYARQFDDFQDDGRTLSDRAMLRAVKAPGDYVRRRRWIRTRVKIDFLSGLQAESESELSVKQVITIASKYLLTLASRFEAQDEIIRAQRVELSRRQQTIREYEHHVSSLVQRMAEAASTGDLQHIGLANTGPVKVIRGGKVKSAGQENVIHGGGGQMGSPSTEEKGFFARLRRRISPQKSATAPPPEFAILKAAETGDMQVLSSHLRGPGKEKAINVVDTQGRTALLYAARSGQMGALDGLVNAGADVKATDNDDRNALHYAARRGCVDVAMWLVQHGLSVTQTDRHALTPLHQAALGKHAGLCLLFLRKGADINARDMNGRTPLMLASRFADGSTESQETIHLLQDWPNNNDKNSVSDDVKGSTS